MLFQAELQTGDEASTCVRSTSCSKFVVLYYRWHNGAVRLRNYYYYFFCKVNITTDYPVNEMKKTLARHIACGVAELSKLRCNVCEIDHPSQLQHDCLLPDDILIDMHFDEAVENVNFTAVIRDWLTLLLAVDLRQSDVAPEQLKAIQCSLEEYPSER